jgi:hypothetical protein
MRSFHRALLALGIACSGAASAQTDTSLTLRPDTSEATMDQRAAAYTVSAAELDSELNSQEVSGVLQSSRDPFNAIAGFTFGQARFRIRGFDGENTLGQHERGARERPGNGLRQLHQLGWA